MNKQKSVWAVWVMGVLLMAMLPLFFIRTSLPLDGACYAYMMIVGGYVGTDQFAAIMTTKRMDDGIKYTGSYKKLRAITVFTFIILVEAIVLQYLNPGKEIPLDLFFLMSGIVGGAFVSGNKVNNAYEGKHGQGKDN